MKKPKPIRVSPMAKSPTPKPKSNPKSSLPTLAEYKQSAAYKSGAMTYKEYVDYFKSRGGM